MSHPEASPGIGGIGPVTRTKPDHSISRKGGEVHEGQEKAAGPQELRIPTDGVDLSSLLQSIQGKPTQREGSSDQSQLGSPLLQILLMLLMQLLGGGQGNSPASNPGGVTNPKEPEQVEKVPER